jgi:OOP family OmpA-OmpF porin
MYPQNLMQGGRSVKSRLLMAVMAIVLFAPAPGHAAWRDNPYRDPAAPCFRWPAGDYDGDGVFDRLDRCNNTPKGCKVDASGCSLDGDNDGVCDGLDSCPNTPPGMAVDEHGCHEGSGAMKDTGTAPPMAKEVEKPKPRPQPVSPPQTESERQLIATGRIRLENVYFETASARLLPESETSLNEAGQALEKFPMLRIEVEGHTDTRGSEAFNQRLSQARAEAVRAYLLEHFKLDAANYSARGYGESRPETRERNDEELLRNRRVVLTVLNPQDLPKGVEVQHEE